MLFALIKNYHRHLRRKRASTITNLNAMFWQTQETNHYFNICASMICVWSSYNQEVRIWGQQQQGRGLRRWWICSQLLWCHSWRSRQCGQKSLHCSCDDRRWAFDARYLLPLAKMSLAAWACWPSIASSRGPPPHRWRCGTGERGYPMCTTMRRPACCLVQPGIRRRGQCPAVRQSNTW